MTSGAGWNRACVATAYWTSVDWEDVVRELDARAAQARASGGRAVAAPDGRRGVPAGDVCAAGSTRRRRWCSGPVPTRGEDERFPSGFTIRAEKCPNRRGVEAGDRRAGRRVGRRGTTCWRSRPAARAYDAVWVAGGYTTRLERRRRRSAKFERHAAADRAGSVPFAAVGAGRLAVAGDGVCRAGRLVCESPDRLQSFEWAIRPPRGVLSEGQLYWRLLGRRGLYNAPQVLREVADEIVYFSAALGPDPAVGVDLKVKQLA